MAMIYWIATMKKKIAAKFISEYRNGSWINNLMNGDVMFKIVIKSCNIKYN